MHESAPFDEIGVWSEVKLDIVRKYASAYSSILAKQPYLHHVYIDAFAGAGVHVSRTSGEFVLGSPLNALIVEPPFKEYYFIDLDAQKTEALRSAIEGRSNVHLYEGDCNHLLIEQVFPNIRREQYRRGLCLLDPYGLHLRWEVIAAAGEMKSVEIFLNFPIMDMNRNVLRRDPDRIEPEQAARMDAFWGDRSWREAAYSTTPHLFGSEEIKESNETIAAAFQRRLKEVAGFKHVLDPMPMRNCTGGVVYYLFFASQNPVAQKMVTDIFNKYRNRGVR